MIRLEQRPYKAKHDIIDWELMPSEPCELNFRPPDASWQHESLTTFLAIWGFVGAMAMLAIIWLQPWLVEIPVWFLTLIGVVVAFCPALRSADQPQVPPIISVMCMSLGIPLLWFCVVELLRVPLLLLAKILLGLALLPLSVSLADQLTAHTVWWTTANPRVSHRMLTIGRMLWKDRFGGRVTLRSLTLSDEVRLALEQLRPGVFYLLTLTIVILQTLVAGHWAMRLVPGEAGVFMVAFMLLAQLPLANWHITRDPTALPLFLQMLKHWCFWGQTADNSPMNLQSPAGAAEQRRTKLCHQLMLSAALTFALWYLSSPLALIDRISGPESSFQQFFFSMLLTCTLLVSLPVLLVLLLLFNLSAPTIAKYVRYYEQKNSPLIDPDWTLFDGYSDRLRSSSNRLERRCQYIGYHPVSQVPIVVDDKLNFEHKLVLGASGIGKTALSLSGQITQQIRRSDGAVVIIDCKGDKALLHTARIEAQKRGVKFKWFTNLPNHSTYVFNPFNQRYLQRLTMHQIVGLFMMSLNLHHGDDYGRAWFSISSRMLFQEALKQIRNRSLHQRPFSFSEFEQAIYQLAADKAEFKAAQHLAFIVANLGQYEQLNLSPMTDPHHPAVQNAIHFPEVIQEKQVIYFSLVGATDVSTVGEIARLALYSAVSAAIEHRQRTGKRPRLYFTIDEAQIVVAQNIQHVLAQARDFGLACTLSLQTLSQLNPPGGNDLRELVLNCTTIKQFFSARDAATQEFLAKMSGQVGYYSASWEQFARRVEQGDVGMHRAVYPFGERPKVQISEEIGWRLTPEDIQDISRHPNRCIMNIARASGYSSFHGTFPVHTDWSLQEAEYDRRSFEMPWPEADDETIDIAPFWPEPNDETVVPSSHPELNPPGEIIAPDRLEEIRRRLLEPDD